MIYICKAGLCDNSTVRLLLAADKRFFQVFESLSWTDLPNVQQKSHNNQILK